MTGKLDGIRTNCITHLAQRVELEYFIKTGYDGADWVYLRGGPTGSESARLDQLTTHHIPVGRGWAACAGTPDRWDELYITAESLAREFGADVGGT